MASIDLLPGDYVLAARVSSYDASETETFVGKIKDDITASFDYETAESNLKEERTTQRDRTHRSLDLELTITEALNVDPLDVMGIDTSDNATDSSEGDTMQVFRLYIFRDEPPSDGTTTGYDEVYEYFQVTPAIDEHNMPTGDHITYSLTMFVENGWKTGKGGGTL